MSRATCAALRNAVVPIGRQYFNGEFDIGLWRPITNDQGPWPKPVGGYWTSTYLPDNPCPSDWVRFMHYERFDWIDLKGTVLDVIPGARVYTVETPDDIQALLENYPRLDVPAKFTDIMASPNFERMSQDYDAVRLTEAGQWRTRFSKPSFYGWDAESTVWLNPGFLTPVETIEHSEELRQGHQYEID